MTKPHGPLGRGLAAVIPEVSTEAGLLTVPLAEIRPNPDQPRTHFDEAALAELAASIREQGILQPLIVTPTDDGYQVVAGERRFRAAQMAGLTDVPVVIRPVDRRGRIALALIENLQREDLNPMEAALAYRRLMEEFGYGAEAVAQVIGKDRSTVANTVRLLKLPERYQEDILAGRMTEGHGRALLMAETEADQETLRYRIVRNGLSVREAERAAAALKRRRSVRAGPAKSRDPNVVALERDLARHLGTRVRIAARGARGRVEITYHSLDELDRLLVILRGRP